MPSEAEEAADPDAADSRYNAGVAELRERTRDRSRFPLVFEENANYGFRRNLLGLRAWGLGLALVTVGVSLALLLLTGESLAHRAARWSLPAAASFALAGFWWKVVTPDWVRVPADAYADRLMEATSTLRDRPAA